jgi:hypothetical protein
VENFLKYFNKEIIKVINGELQIEKLKKTVTEFQSKKIKDIENVENFKVEEHKDLFFQLFLKHKKEKEFIKPILFADEIEFMNKTKILKLKENCGAGNCNILYVLMDHSLYFTYDDNEIEMLDKITDKAELKKAVEKGVPSHSLCSSSDRILKILECYSIERYIISINPINYKEIIVSENEFFFTYPELIKYKKLLVSVDKGEKGELLIFWPCERKIFSEELNLEMEWKESFDFLKEKIRNVLLERRLESFE